MPRWSDTKKAFVRGESGVSVASAARTATGNSGALDGSDVRAVDAQVVVSAVSGTTPSMTVTIEESTDGSTGWTAVSGASSGAITTASTVALRGTIVRRYYRFVWTITGTTPSFTFRIDADTK